MLRLSTSQKEPGNVQDLPHPDPPHTDNGEVHPFTALDIRVPSDFDMATLPKMPKYVGNFKPGRSFRIDMTPNGTTAERNEVGAKRVAKLLEVLGDNYELGGQQYRSTSTLEQFREYHQI